MTIASNSTDDGEALRIFLERSTLQLRTATPCVVDSVSADGTTVDVRPAVSQLQRLDDQTLTLDMPVVRGVPLQLLGSSTLGLFVAVPVRPGDDGLLIVTDRALDNWQHGAGILPPPDMRTPRHHDLTDAVFIPGLQRLSGAVPGYPTTAVQVRNRAGTCLVEVDADSVHATTPDGSDLVMGSGAITMSVPGGAVLAMTGDTVAITGKLVVTESVASPSILADGAEVSHHDHGGVVRGGVRTNPLPT